MSFDKQEQSGFEMGSFTNIPEDFLKWCFENTNILESSGVNKSGREVNLIHFASEKGYVQVVEKLVQTGIDVNLPAPNPGKKTPLHIASEHGHIEVANLHLQNKVNAPAHENATPLHFASRYGHLEIVSLLLEHGADINCQNDQNMTPIHQASFHGHLEVVKLLLLNKADINCQSNGKVTPLHFAIKNNHLKVARLLITYGGNINAQTLNHKWTPLHFAALYGQKESVELLLEYDADLNIKDQNGKTAEDIAREKGYDEIVGLISKKKFESVPTNCIICCGPKNGVFAFLPCYHAVACEFCCSRVIASTEEAEAKCPICRRKVNQFQKIYM